MKQKLVFEKDSYDAFKGVIDYVAEMLPAAMKELKNHGVNGGRGLTYEKLKDGNFVENFHTYHKGEQQKSNITKKMLYDKFLDLYGYNTDQLQELERNYKSGLSREFKLYTYNDSFFKYCEVHVYQNPQLKRFLNKGVQKVYRFFDFVTIKGNNISINIPEEPFTIYSTSPRQIATMERVKAYVENCSWLGIEYSKVHDPIQQYLTKRNTFGQGPKGQIGLSSDFKELNFNYNNILTIK